MFEKKAGITGKMGGEVGSDNSIVDPRSRSVQTVGDTGCDIIACDFCVFFNKPAMQ